MEKPRYPKEWLNLRLEFKDKGLEKKSIKQMKEIEEKELNSENDLENPPIIIRHGNPLKSVSILKNPNEKITDLNDKKSNKIFYNSSQYILM
jgi:hypothetical protein